MIRRVLRNGVVAGAAGTTALNAATYIDMAVRGRGASKLPREAVEEIASRASVQIPGAGEPQTNRKEGMGALTGMLTGCGVGIVGAVLAPVLRPLPTSLAGLGLGAVAMAASDVPMARLGLTNPKQWSPADWIADVLPHAAYGIVTAWAATTLSRRS